MDPRTRTAAEDVRGRCVAAYRLGGRSEVHGPAPKDLAAARDARAGNAPTRADPLGLRGVVGRIADDVRRTCHPVRSPLPL